MCRGTPSAAALVDVACALGMTCGALGKVGRDITLLAQTEVGEVAEAPAPGRGGSSSMPHKRNPVRSARAVAAAVQAPGLVATMLSAMVQEHERAVGGWQAEWDTLPALVDLARDAAQAMAEALAHLVVDEPRMRANLDAAGGVARAEGLVAALAPALGRRDAMALVERICRRAVAEGRALHDAAADEPQVRAHLDVAGIARALDPASFARIESHVRRPRAGALAAREGVRTAMDDDQRREAGMAIRRTVLGDAHVDRAVAATTPLTADFQDLITRYAWGEIWTRPGLDLRSRRAPGDRHDDRPRPVGGTADARPRGPRRWRPQRRRAQGDRAAAGDLLRRAGGAPCAGRAVGRAGRGPSGG